MNEEDYEVEDIFNNTNKKRKNSGRKGRRGENNLCKILIERFNKPFSRVVGSGNRWSQTVLTEEAKKILTGDIVVPNEFKFCLECKHGYAEIDLCNVLKNGNSTLEEFMKQAEKDAKRINKMPLLCWKKDRLPWIAFLKKEDVDYNSFNYKFCYKDWIGVCLIELLKKEDDYFFEK